MALPDTFLDEIRLRTALSALIGRTLKLTKAGREWKACCPFHGEKTPSFTVNDDKGFYHCFGCGAHGDAFRWLTDQAGLEFMDAVRQLAAEAGLELPARSEQAEQQAARVETVRGALETAQGVFSAQLEQAGAVMEYLTGAGPKGRGLSPAEIAAFGIGYARGGDGSLRPLRIGEKLGLAAGLLVTNDDGSLRELFFDRVTIPIHDHRGQLVGFGGRVWPGRRSDTPKFLNSPDSPLFDKGRTLFNLHRAAPAARPAPPSALRAATSGAAGHSAQGDGEDRREGRLLIVEGYFDVIALARAGIHAAVAPMGTALTGHQLTRAWRVHHRPTLLFDGDAAGRKAALRAARVALPAIGPGRELAVALLPDGFDPDDLVRVGRVHAIDAALAFARPLHAFVFEELVAAMPERSPETVAAVWAELDELARGIADDETRAQYLGLWRARFERELSLAAQLVATVALHAMTPADPDPDHGDVPMKDGVAYAFPESESDSAARLIALVRRLLAKRAERKAITEEIGDALKMAEAIGFVKKEITEVVRNIESDLAHGPAVREEAEMARVLYRRTLGIRGPMSAAMLPSVVDARPRPASATIKRRATMNALIDARSLDVARDERSLGV